MRAYTRLLVPVVAALLLTACGGDDNDNDNGGDNGDNGMAGGPSADFTAFVKARFDDSPNAAPAPVNDIEFDSRENNDSDAYNDLLH